MKNAASMKSSNPTLLGIYPEELKSASQRDINAPLFFATLFTIAKM